MGKQRHTPGEWTHRQAYTDGEPNEQVIQRGAEVLASVHDLGNDRLEEMEANARVMHAAPELLEACEAIEQDLRVIMPAELVKHFGASRSLLQRVIRKAREA